jgi:hypothetical protein
MSLIVVGTMAFDAIETPFGKIDKIIGGSAVYALMQPAILFSPLTRFQLLATISQRRNSGT